jgi:adenylate kinase family enzyme
MNAKGSLHLIVGPVGAGKSTFARGLMTRQNATFLDLDAWMVRQTFDHCGHGVAAWSVLQEFAKVLAQSPECL